MSHVATAVSADGTRIAFERGGEGPAVVLVDGALCSREVGPSGGLARALAPGFTVLRYDRRGRGLSTDTKPYAVQREIEDLDAVVMAAGGSACLWGMSSGALLALKYAAAHPGKVRKVSVYEAPCIVDDGHPPTAGDWARIALAVEHGDPGAAVRTFLASVGVPGFAIALMRWLPMWARLRALAPTLPYDGQIVEPFQRGVPIDPSPWTPMTAPAQVVAGAKSPLWMRDGNRGLCGALPSARFTLLEGQTHNLRPRALAPLLARFFAEP